MFKSVAELAPSNCSILATRRQFMGRQEEAAGPAQWQDLTPQFLIIFKAGAQREVSPDEGW
jgi:hypothetical protein